MTSEKFNEVYNMTPEDFDPQDVKIYAHCKYKNIVQYNI